VRRRIVRSAEDTQAIADAISPDTVWRRLRKKRNGAPAAPAPQTSQDDALLVLRQTVAARMNNAPHDLITLPGVQPLSAMTRFVEGGRERIVELIQMAVQNNDATATAWWQVYRELPSYTRAIVSFDDICAASNVKPKDLLICLVSTAIDFSQDTGNLVAAILSPKIIAKLAESAERLDGPFAEIAHKDRLAFLQGRSFLPAPKGAVIVNVAANAQAAAAASHEPSVPSFARDLGGGSPHAIEVTTVTVSNDE